MSDSTSFEPDHPPASEVALVERWRLLQDAATVVVPPAGRYVILAPHPDDEVLTVGGLIVRLMCSGADVTVVGVTDGGNAYPGIFDHDDLAALRRREQTACLERLGLAADRVLSLGLRDGCVTEREVDLVDEILPLCTPGTTVVAPWTHDVHTDHEAVGRAAAVAASSRGCSIWFSLFWAWHHAPQHDLEALDLIRIQLDEEVRKTKEAALQCHTSQLGPTGTTAMLDAARLEPARWNAEYFIPMTPDTLRR